MEFLKKDIDSPVHIVRIRVLELIHLVLGTDFLVALLA